jgi:DNA repair exonuclease SbcCD nuclease subunit
MKTKGIPRFVVWLSALFLCAPTLRADWSFAMLGDTRGDPDTATGVSLYLNTIAQKIASLNPELVMVAGDLCNGTDLAAGSPLTYAEEFANWKTAMQPVFNYNTDTGIPIYTVRGNHEAQGAPEALKQAYYDAFSAYVPFNGPNNGSDDDQRGFSWSFSHSNVTFVAADQYFNRDRTGESGYHSLDQTWVNQQFHETNSAYKVFMVHEPFFMTVGCDSEEHFFGTSAAAFETRTNFWNALGTNGVQLALCGHVHYQSVATTTNDYGNSIIQLLAGNGGAPYETVGDTHDPGVSVHYTNGLYGFSLATVSEDAMTIQYYLLHTNDNSWSVASYVTTIAPNQVVPEPSAAVLLAPAVAMLATGHSRRRRRH